MYCKLSAKKTIEEMSFCNYYIFRMVSLTIIEYRPVTDLSRNSFKRLAVTRQLDEPTGRILRATGTPRSAVDTGHGDGMVMDMVQWG